MSIKSSRSRWLILCVLLLIITQACAWTAETPAVASPLTPVLTNAAAVRNLSPEQAAKGLPVRLQGVVTFGSTASSCFIQDESAGIYVGDGATFGPFLIGDLVAIEGVSGPGEYAPIVRPTSVRALGRAPLPVARRVSFEDLVTGREDSQWVEIVGLVRTVHGEASNVKVFELATGGGRLSVYIPEAVQIDLDRLVDSQVRIRGVCGTWFNRLRQLFGVRLLVPRVEDITVEEMSVFDARSQPAQPIGNLLRFAPQASSGHRVKVTGTVVCQQPGRALFVQDEQHGLYVQTRQSGSLQPGDLVELLGFPAHGEYTPMLQDASWHKVGSGTQPSPALIRPDEALGGLHDSRLVSIDGILLNRSSNDREVMLVLEADGSAFSAHIDFADAKSALGALQINSKLRLTGVCRIEVGEDWRAAPDWRAKSFRMILRTPDDVKVLNLPPWWNLTRLLWAIGILVAVVAVAVTWAAMLNRKVGQQTKIIRNQLALEGTLRERYQDLFENANDMVYTHDLGGRITSINLAGERLLGHGRDRINRSNLLEFIAEEQRPAASEWLEHIVDGAAPNTVEWDFVSTSNDRIRLEISTRLIDREGRRVEVEGIARDVTERRRLEKEILEISTREQRRIGHDLHDGVCQQLAGIAFLSDILADKLDEQRRPETAEARKITELVHKTNAQTRGVARGLFPVRLEENGLLSALEELSKNAGSFFNTQCRFHCEAPVTVQDHTVAHHLYYIAQEAILNAVKHGKARLIQLRLKAQDDSGCIMMVSDDGIGFAPTEGLAQGMGIRIMKYRARMIGADLLVRSVPGAGTEVVCRFSGELKSTT